jgi:hypothetical protein
MPYQQPSPLTTPLMYIIIHSKPNPKPFAHPLPLGRRFGGQAASNLLIYDVIIITPEICQLLLMENR